MTDPFAKTAAELKNTFDHTYFQKAKFIPSARKTVAIFCALKDYLYQYPLESGREMPQFTLASLAQRLEEQILKSLCFMCQEKADCARCEAQAHEITGDFIRALPDIQRLLISDVNAAYEGDPAAISPIEPLLCYPGVTAVTLQRLAHYLHQKGVRLIPRIVTEYAHSVTGIDIHPGASIGPGFFIDHGTGVVIGETCVIGANVKLYQGVTLGARSFPLDAAGNPIKNIPRPPILEDRVVVYSNATVLGRIRVGHDAVIGGNLWVTHDVEPGARLAQPKSAPDTAP